jgi:hypothetical protein
MSEKIIAYKATDKNMMCRGKQYEVGKTYTEEKADCCTAGMHACEVPFDVLHYYHVSDGARFFQVECGGEVDKSSDDSKLACTELTVKGELKLTDMLKIGVEAVMKRVKEKTAGAKETAASGYCSTGAASGYYSTGAASGNYSTGAASGYYSTGAASGYYSTGAASGYCSTGAASGYYSTGAASGNYSTGAASGYYSTGAASGYYSTGAASGYYSTGAASGNYSTGAASGDYSTGAASGDYSTAEVSGKDSIAVANGYNSKARGSIGCYIVLTEYDDDGKFLLAKMARVDGTVIKDGVWYTLKNGEFVEAE